MLSRTRSIRSSLACSEDAHYWTLVDGDSIHVVVVGSGRLWTAVEADTVAQNV